MADQNWMDNGVVLALGATALLGAVGVARAGWRGEFGGGIDLPFFGARGGVESQVRIGARDGSAGRYLGGGASGASRAGAQLAHTPSGRAGEALANYRWHGDPVYAPTPPGSKNETITQILDVYGHRGKTRTTWRKKLKGLAPHELQAVYTEVMATA